VSERSERRETLGFSVREREEKGEKGSRAAASGNVMTMGGIKI
jgi:hypothetical protein